MGLAEASKNITNIQDQNYHQERIQVLTARDQDSALLTSLPGNLLTLASKRYQMLWLLDKVSSHLHRQTGERETKKWVTDYTAALRAVKKGQGENQDTFSRGNNVVPGQREKTP